MTDLHVTCRCGRTGTFVDADEALRAELERAPWACIYHDHQFRWHTRRPDREAALQDLGQDDAARSR